MSQSQDQNPSHRDDCKRAIKEELNPEKILEKILCDHCLRTAKNGIKCQGICVADSNY
jgi:hypothetical protein